MEKEFYKSLVEFANYLDNMSSCKDKVKLSTIFTKFTICYNHLLQDEWLLDKYGRD